MARRNESSLIEDMTKVPWWISAILAVISYLGLRFLVPSMLQSRADLLSQGLAKAAPSLAPFALLVFGFTGIVSLILGVIRKKKEDKNAGRKHKRT